MRLSVWITSVGLIGGSLGMVAGYLIFRPEGQSLPLNAEIETKFGTATLRYDAAYDSRGVHSGGGVVLVTLYPDLRPAISMAQDNPRQVILQIAQ